MSASDDPSKSNRTLDPDEPGPGDPVADETSPANTDHDPTPDAPAAEDPAVAHTTPKRTARKASKRNRTAAASASDSTPLPLHRAPVAGDPPPKPNPTVEELVELLEDAPCQPWELYDLGKEEKTVEMHQSVMTWIDDEIIKLTESFDAEVDGVKRRLPRTTRDPAFFKLAMRFPEREGDDVPLAFSFQDLYLLGFRHGNTWYFFNDARIDFGGKDAGDGWEKLKFDGGYSGHMYKTVPLGNVHIGRVYDTLAHYPDREKNRQEVPKALYCIMVTISEAKRFPEVLAWLHNLFLQGYSSPAGPYFDTMFKNWSKVCREVFKGKDGYKVVMNYPTYGDAVSGVAVLLNSSEELEVEQRDPTDLHRATEGTDPANDTTGEEEEIGGGGRGRGGRNVRGRMAGGGGGRGRMAGGGGGRGRRGGGGGRRGGGRRGGREGTVAGGAMYNTDEAACQEMRSTRLFHKVLGTVLNFGNFMSINAGLPNSQTLEPNTLLKIVDVKGADGKAALVQFVVQEMLKHEGCKLNTSTLQGDAEYRKHGLQVVSKLAAELTNTKKAASIDITGLSSTVSELGMGLGKVHDVLRLNSMVTSAESARRFHNSMSTFLRQAEEVILKIQSQESSFAFQRKLFIKGNVHGLGVDALRMLTQIVLTSEEELKLKYFKDDSVSRLCHVEAFVKAVLDVPFVFKRVDAMLYIATFYLEVNQLRMSYATLEAACQEMRSSRLFHKVLGTVLNFGNFMSINADVKGADGKAALVQFVVQEMLKPEGPKMNTSTLQGDAAECRKHALQLVSKLAAELSNTKKATAVDIMRLSRTVSEHGMGLGKVHDVLRLNSMVTSAESARRFHNSTSTFLRKVEEEIQSALLEGNAHGLGVDALWMLTQIVNCEEELKLKYFKDDSVSRLCHVEAFVKAVLDVPFVFKRVDAMLYIATFYLEVNQLRMSYATIEAACQEMRRSRLFHKVLGAVLNFGNFMSINEGSPNSETLEPNTLLKIVDVKGADGKAALLQFVVQEMLKPKGCKMNTSTLQGGAEYQKHGLQAVSKLAAELSNTKKAASMDITRLTRTVSDLGMGLGKVHGVLRQNSMVTSAESAQSFHNSMSTFLRQAEEEMTTP